MNCTPALHHKQLVILNEYESKVKSCIRLNYTLKTDAFTGLWTEKARSMYEGKERIKERVGEERALFQAPVSSAASNQTYSPVLCYKTGCRINEKLLKGCLIWTVD